MRKKAKSHGSQQYIEGLRDTDGHPVIVVEDVCTTGGSALKAIGHARDAGLKVIGVICLVDREQGGREAIEAAGYPFVRIFTMSELVTQNDT